MNETEYAIDALREIRKSTLMMVIAGEYMNKSVFLTKLGKEIEKYVLKLKNDITALKKEFPGKFKTEIDTEKILERFNKTVKTLLNPEEDTFNRCAEGSLGLELEKNVKEAEKAVNEIKTQVYGSRAVHKKKDSMGSLVRGLDSLGSAFGNILFKVIRVLAVLLLVVIIGFLSLYFTMEREAPLLKKIEQNQALIDEQRELLLKNEKRKAELAEEIKSLEKKTASRDDRIALLELDVEKQKLTQDNHNIEAQIQSYESTIDEYRQRIDEINEKPLIKRLLRQ